MMRIYNFDDSHDSRHNNLYIPSNNCLSREMVCLPNKYIVFDEEIQDSPYLFLNPISLFLKKGAHLYNKERRKRE